MIDPKEKAEEIVWKYLPLLQGWADPYKTQKAIECAKVDVQNTLEAVTTIADKKHEYYQEVLNELNKMQNYDTRNRFENRELCFI